MKRLVPIVLLVAVALLVVPLASAAGKPGGGFAHGKAKFDLVGTLNAVDATAGTITVKVKAGTKTVRAWRGVELTMTVDANARIRLVTADGCTTVTLADLPTDAKVKVRGRIDRTDPAAPLFTAHVVKVKAPPAEDVPPAPAP